MRKILAVTFLVFLMSLVGWGSEEDKKEVVLDGGSQYNQANFDLALLDTNGNVQTITPDGKIIYAYFTGIG